MICALSLKVKLLVLQGTCVKALVPYLSSSLLSPIPQGYFFCYYLHILKCFYLPLYFLSGSARYRIQCWKYFFRRQAWPFPFYLPGLFSKSPVILNPCPCCDLTPHTPSLNHSGYFFSEVVWLTSKYVFRDFFVCFSPIMLDLHWPFRCENPCSQLL